MVPLRRLATKSVVWGSLNERRGRAWGVRVAGGLHLLTVTLAHFTPIPADWDENLRALPDVHRRFAIAQNVFIGGVMIFAGIASLSFAPELVSGATSARIVCAGIALWWGARLIVLPRRKIGANSATGVSAPVRPTCTVISRNTVSACSGMYFHAFAHFGNREV